MPVCIGQVANGNYPMAQNTMIQNLPQPHLVSIIGNEGSPASVTLTATTGGNMLYFHNVRGITFSGFKLVSSAATTGRVSSILLGGFSPIAGLPCRHCHEPRT